MDAPLRCNFLNESYCRKPLREKAVVTSCSHIFCEDCITRSGFTRLAIDHNRLCPACKTALPNTHDVVMVDMHPCEEFKSTVLAGLDPSTILECAGRALSVWNYQLGQEVSQAHLAKSLTQKYATLNNQVQNIVDNANTEISDLQKRLEALAQDQKATEARNAEIARLYEQKSKRYSQLQTLYNSIKARVQGGDMRQAASRDVDRTLQNILPTSFSHALPRTSASTQPHPVDRNGLEQLHPFQRSGSAAGTSSDHGRSNMRPSPARHKHAHRVSLPTHATPAAQGPLGVGLGLNAAPSFGLSAEARRRAERGGGIDRDAKRFEDFLYR